MPDNELGELPDLAPRYRIEEQLGAGATAVVYGAVDTVENRRVAIKVLRPELVQSVGAERFVREIRLASTLSHAGIVALLDAGEVDGRPYAVMPFVEGETLRSRLDRDVQLRLEAVVSILTQVAAALDHAHEKGIVHRDIKPENILLTRESALVLDFGLAYALHAAGGERLTRSGIAVGTPAYMSPEQSGSERRLDGRSDVYSLACVTYEMLTGEPPFTGASAQAVRARHAVDVPPRVCIVRPTLPSEVDDVLGAGLAKAPADRIATPGEFAQRFVRAAGGRGWPVRRWRRITGTALALAAAVVLAVWLPNWSSPGAPGARSWVLVADFASPESDPTLGSAVRDLVTAELNQSPALSLVPQEQLLIARRNAHIPDTARLDIDRARELAFRSSVKVVITGGVQNIGAQGYSITLRAITADSGSEILSRAASVRDEGSKFVQAVERLVRQLRRELGERSADIAATRPLENVSTPSLTAFRGYHDALARLRVGDYEGSIVLIRRAVAIDSAFASGWSLMASAYVNLRQPDSARANFRRAERYPERLSDADRDRLRADLALHVDRDFSAAVQSYDNYLAQRPASIGGHNNRAIALSALGRDEDALHGFQVATAIDPLKVGPRQIELNNVASEMIVLGWLDSARAVRARLESTYAQYTDMLLLNAEGKWDSLAALAGALGRDPSVRQFSRFPALLHEAGAMAAMGHLDRAERRLRELADSASGADMRWFVHARLLFDRANATPTAWPLPPALNADTSMGAEYLRGLWAAQRGDTTRARAVLQSLGRRTERERRTLGFDLAYLTAILALRRGDAAGALAVLREPAQLGEHEPFGVDREGSLAIRLAAAEALWGVGQSRDAIAMLGRVVAPTGLPPGHYPMRGLVVWSVGRRLEAWRAKAGG